MIFNTFSGKGYISKFSQNGDNLYVDIAVLMGIDDNKKNIYQYGSFYAGDSVKSFCSNMLDYQLDIPNEGYKNPLSGVMIDIEIVNYASKPWKQGDKNGINTSGILTKVSCN